MDNIDVVVWMIIGIIYVVRVEEWSIMSIEWVYILLKLWNFFDETLTLGALKKDK